MAVRQLFRFANSIEHGSGAIALESVARSGRLRLVVVDGGEGPGPGDRGDLDAAGPVGGPPRHAHRRGAGATTRPAQRLRAGRRRRDPRRGHGLRVVAQIAAEHGGRFVACRDRARTSAVLELPLAEG